MTTEAPHNAHAVADSTRITGLQATEEPANVEEDTHWETNRGSMPQASLTDWFKRPVRTKVFTLDEGADIIADFDPWKDYLNHPTITPKLEGYRLWRGNLKIKFLVTGSPYQYCPIIVSYKPLTAAKEDGEPELDETFDFSGATAPQYTSYQGDPRKLEMVHLSLRPHIMLYPHLSQGGEMSLPFVYPLDWQKFPYPGPETTYYSVRRLNMGKLSIRTLTPLATCSSSAGRPVTITAFCWMENLELSVPTVGTFVEQSMFGNTPAQIVSNVSNSVASTAWMPKLVRTGAGVLGKVADVASMLGFTKHSVVEDAKPMRVGGNMHMAATNVSVASEVLAVEAGNNLSIDPSVMAPSSEDEMSIPNICGRPCLTYKFTWDSGLLPNTIIAQGPVTPENYLVTEHLGASGHTYNQVVMTNTAQVASLFKYWRGPITYTFQVVSTAFHKGRLYVSWEPDVNANGFSTTYQRTEVLDISESDRLEFTIDFAKPEAWSRSDSSVIRDPLNLITSWQSGATVPNYKDGAYCNGKLVVRVMNDLVSPVATAPVEVLVWVSGPGLEFAFPLDVGSSGYGVEDPGSALTFLDPFVLQSVTKTVESVQGGASTSLGAAPSSGDSSVYMGEQVLSLKSLCQRTNLLCSFTQFQGGNGAPNAVMSVEMPRFPYPLAIGTDRNSVPIGIPLYSFPLSDGLIREGSTTVKVRSSFNRNLPYHFIASAYAGIRGSVEYRVLSKAPLPSNLSGTTQVGRYIRSSNDDAVTYLDVSKPLTLPPTAEGVAINTPCDGVLTVKMPMYSALKFLSPNLTRQMFDNSSDWLRVQHDMGNHTSFTAPFSKIFFNTGDDFSAGWYLNPSTIYASRVPYRAD
jgi:hypothetical protein